MQIEINDDMVNKIVIDEIKEAVLRTLDEPYELYFDTQRAYELVDSMLDVLEYFMLSEDYDDFVFSLPPREDVEPSAITVTDVHENDDGSAEVTFDIPKKDMPAFVGEGMKFVLIKSIFDNPSDDQLIEWIERGKQEERVDKRVEELLKDFENG